MLKNGSVVSYERKVALVRDALTVSNTRCSRAYLRTLRFCRERRILRPLMSAADERFIIGPARHERHCAAPLHERNDRHAQGAPHVPHPVIADQIAGTPALDLSARIAGRCARRRHDGGDASCGGRGTRGIEVRVLPAALVLKNVRAGAGKIFDSDAGDHRATDGHYVGRFLAEIDRPLRASESL